MSDVQPNGSRQRRRVKAAAPAASIDPTVPPEVLPLPPPLQIAVTMHQGSIRMAFSGAVNWITMSPRDALHLATLIRVRAERLIIDAEDGAR